MPEFWLTDEDKDLVGAYTGIDPLGLMPIWSNRGRKIVRHITEVSRLAQGFQILVTGLGLYELYRDRPDRTLPPEAFFLLVEQAFARSVFKATGKYALPGTLRLRAQRDDRILLGLHPDHYILGDQKANGVWGYYRGAAMRAGILDKSGRVLSQEFFAQMALDTKTLLSKRAMSNLFSCIDQVAAQPDKPALLKGQVIRNELANIYATLPEHKIIREYLYPAGTIELDLVKFLRRQRANPEKIDLPLFFKNCKEEFKEHSDDFEHIIRCENLMAPLERIFRYLFNFVDDSITTAARNLPIDLQALDRAHRQFQDSGVYSGGTHALYQIYCTTLDCSSSKTSFVRSLLECHHKVATNRKRQPWIYEENGKLRSYTDPSPPKELHATPGAVWINDYYIFPLLNVYRALVTA